MTKLNACKKLVIMQLAGTTTVHVESRQLLGFELMDTLYAL